MTYKIYFSEKSRKQFKKLAKPVKSQIVRYLETRVSKSPYDYGKKLKGNFGECWRYRVGDYRIICKVENNNLTVIVVEAGHR